MLEKIIRTILTGIACLTINGCIERYNNFTGADSQNEVGINIFSNDYKKIKGYDNKADYMSEQIESIDLKEIEYCDVSDLELEFNEKIDYNEAKEIIPCIPGCINQDGSLKECGDNGCGGVCGTCPPPAWVCGSNYMCDLCAPDCLDKECGDNGCGGMCGYCPPEEKCTSQGSCVNQ